MERMIISIKAEEISAKTGEILDKIKAIGGRVESYSVEEITSDKKVGFSQ